MKLAPKSRYAIRLLFELEAAGQALSMSTLCDRTGLSPRVVETIHAELKRRGVTEASVGAKGGLSLLVPLKDISLGQVVDWFENGVEFAVCCGEKAYDCPQRQTCVNRATWRAVSRKVRETLEGISLADIAGGYADRASLTKGGEA